MTRRVVVSVHDVCAASRPAVANTLAALDARGIRARSLLVIPTDLDAVTGAWLRARAAAGDEVVLHGLHHRRLPDQCELRGLDALRNRVLARGAGEFLGLSFAEARERVTTGLALLAGHGLTPTGFIAPAWLYGPDAAEAVRACGLRYLVTQLRVRDLRRGRDTWSYGLSNRPGPAKDDYGGRLLNTLILGAEAPLPLLRIALHPADLDFCRPFDYTLRVLDRLLDAGRAPLTYAQWLEVAP